MRVRSVRVEELPEVTEMMRALWPAGVGRALVGAVEAWCRENRFRELGSDVEVENEDSLRAHSALGFEPTLRLQFFRKRLDLETVNPALPVTD